MLCSFYVLSFDVSDTTIIVISIAKWSCEIHCKSGWIPKRQNAKWKSIILLVMSSDPTDDSDYVRFRFEWIGFYPDNTDMSAGGGLLENMFSVSNKPYCLLLRLYLYVSYLNIIKNRADVMTDPILYDITNFELLC